MAFSFFSMKLTRGTLLIGLTYYRRGSGHFSGEKTIRDVVYYLGKNWGQIFIFDFTRNREN